MDDAGQPPGKCGAPANAEVVDVLVVEHVAPALMLTELSEPVYLLGDELDIVVDADHCNACGCLGDWFFIHASRTTRRERGYAANGVPFKRAELQAVTVVVNL